MNKLRITRSIILAACFVAALCWLSWRKGATEDAPPTSAERVERSLRQLKASDSKTASQGSLRELRGALRQMSTQEAVKWILRELDAAKDFPTQLDFTIGTDQNLTGWPSYRVFLLDALMLVDPTAAAVKAREILQSTSSADEWAVAMRNLARGRGSPEDEALLKAKSAELLRRRDWHSQPSAGYLQAFDVIVHTKQTALAPELVVLCDQRDQQAVRHAAFLTLDRLVLAEPGQTLPVLAVAASAHPSSGLMISNMLARADVRDAEQRQAVESYLLDEKRTADELAGFAGVFPNANIAVSDNLLTKPSTINGSDLIERDRAALHVVTAWLKDSRFSRSHLPLRETYRRLREFVDR